MKKVLLLSILCMVLGGRSYAQFTADLTGYPLVTTGWNIGGFATVVDSTVQLTSPSTNQAGYVYYNTPTNLTGCGQFTVDFDYRIVVTPASTVADGIAFWYISNPPSGFVTGGGIGLPTFANGLIMIMDTYDNIAPVNVPLATLLGYNGSISGYTEGSAAGLLAPVAPSLSYITDGTWRHCKITYNVGAINVYFNYSATPTLTGTYPLTISGYFGFSSSTGAAYSTQSVKSVHITAVTALAHPTVTSPVTYCQFDAATPLTATGDPGSTLLWFTTDTATVVSLPGAPTPSTATAGTTWYYVRQSSGTCMSPPDSIRVIVNAQPAAPVLSGLTRYCQNATFIPFTATGTGIQWYTGPTGGTGSTTAPTVPTATVGVYSNYATQTVSGCESPRASIVVTVDPTSATPTFLTGDTTYCQYTPFNPVTVSGTNIKWYTVATGGTGSTTSPTINTSVAGITHYYVTQTDAFNCESDRLPVTFTVYARPAAPTTVPIHYCQGITAPPLTAGGTNLTWYGTGVTPGSATAPTPAADVTGTYDYYVTQTVNGCVGDSALLSVIIDSTPVTPVVSTNSPVCQGDTLKLISSSATSGVIYEWTGPAPYAATGQNPYIFNATPAATGFYTLTVTYGPCTATAIVNASVTPTPPLAITNNSPVCTGIKDTIFFHAFTDPGATFDWTGPYSFASSAQDPMRNPVEAEYAGDYHLTVFVNGCYVHATSTVIVHPTPTGPWVKWIDYCQHFPAPPLMATGSNLLWYPSSSSTTGSPIPPTPSTDNVGFGFYYVNQTVEGCPSIIDSIKVTVYPKPTVTVSNDTAICPRDSLVLKALDEDAVAYYHWYPSMYLNYDTAQPAVVARPETNMNYYVVASNQYGCTDTGYVSVTVRSDAVIHLKDSVTIYPGETYQIDPSTNCTTMRWSPPGGLSSPYISNPVAAPETNTKYVVTGTTEWGCRTKDSISVYVSTEPLLAMPNAFAPGSGMNSKFKVVKRGIAVLQHFRVFDRWGIKVYESNNIDEGWDGTYNGVPQPLGVYIYELDAISSSGKEFIKKGNVTLLR